MPQEFFSTRTVGQTTNTTRQIEQKILTALNAGGGSGGSSLTGNFFGTGSPQGVVTASTGATYIDTSGNHFWSKTSGTNTNTGWSELIA